MNRTRILIVEDDRAVARGLEFGLSKEGFSVTVASTGQQALEIAHSQELDLVLLDLRLPDISGYDVCKQLRAEGKRMPILILTALDDEIDRVLGLELGADDYIVKPYRLRELIARIRAHLRRAYGELAEVKRGERIVFGEIEIDLERLQVTRQGKVVYLTPTEFRLLRFLASNPDRPFNRSALIEAVWGYDSDVEDERTIDVHIRHLREKIEDDPSNPRWIVTVRGMGYKFQR